MSALDALLAAHSKKDLPLAQDAQAELIALRAELGALRLAGHHPLRRELLARFLADHDAEWSPTELSEAVRHPLGVVAYHVRQLVRSEVITLTRTRPRRGAIEHFYRLSGSKVLGEAGGAR